MYGLYTIHKNKNVIEVLLAKSEKNAMKKRF